MLGNVDEMQRLTNKQKQVSASGYSPYQVTFQNSKSFIHYLNDTWVVSRTFAACFFMLLSSNHRYHICYQYSQLHFYI